MLIEYTVDNEVTYLFLLHRNNLLFLKITHSAEQDQSSWRKHKSVQEENKLESETVYEAFIPFRRETKSYHDYIFKIYK